MAAERTFQSLLRMTRFARTEGKPALGAVIQTAFPEHHSIKAAAAGDFEGFFAEEIDIRRLLGLPPFIASAEIVFSGRDARELGRVARTLAGRWREADPAVRVLGPSFITDAGRPGIKRIQLELRADRSAALTALLADGLKDAGLPGTVTRHDALTS
jgi:primosomal protein N' (replication factor Y)